MVVLNNLGLQTSLGYLKNNSIMGNTKKTPTASPNHQVTKLINKVFSSTMPLLAKATIEINEERNVGITPAKSNNLTTDSKVK